MGRSKYSRKARNTIQIKKCLWVIINSEKTEFHYLKEWLATKHRWHLQQFRFGKDPLTTLMKTIRSPKFTPDINDPIWFVFDVDDMTHDCFEQCKKICYENNINLAHSNRSFEVWLLLHFSLYKCSEDNPTMETSLSKHLKGKYDKTSEDIFSRFESRLPRAIANAEKLIDHHHSLDNDYNSYNCKPVTFFHKLIMSLVDQS